MTEKWCRCNWQTYLPINLSLVTVVQSCVINFNLSWLFFPNLHPTNDTFFLLEGEEKEKKRKREEKTRRKGKKSETDSLTPEVNKSQALQESKPSQGNVSLKFNNFNWKSFLPINLLTDKFITIFHSLTYLIHQHLRKEVKVFATVTRNLILSTFSSHFFFLFIFLHTSFKHQNLIPNLYDSNQHIVQLDPIWTPY